MQGHHSNRLEGIGGWLLVYAMGSIPLMMVYSVGLSGWFFNYPVVLMLVIFLLLAVPLVLIVLKSPHAPQWNVSVVWIMVVLMTLRSLSVFVFPMANEDQPPLSREELPAIVAALSGIVSVALVWAIAWTKYFNASVRVRSTFDRVESSPG